jgi:preprotein translocase subunit Sss1
MMILEIVGLVLLLLAVVGFIIFTYVDPDTDSISG